MTIKLTYKVLRHSILTVLIVCYFVLIGIHASSISSLITSSDIAPYMSSKVWVVFLCFCWFSGLLLFVSSVFRTQLAFRYYWAWRSYRQLLGLIRYFILNGLLYFFPDLLLRYGAYVKGVSSDSAFYLGIVLISVLLVGNRYRGLVYEEQLVCA